MNDNEERSVNDNEALARMNEPNNFFSELWEKIRLVYKLLLDPEVPIYLKALPFVGLIYLLLPFDFLPDVIPGLGQLDDLTILFLGLKMFIDMAPHQVVQRHIKSMRYQADSISATTDQPARGYLEDDPDIIEGIIIDSSDVVDSTDNG